jgi:predicted enzyme related to lactoylglutathione lyase
MFGWEIDADNPMNYGTIQREGNTTDDGVGIGGGVGQGPEGYTGHVTFYVQVPDVEAALKQAEDLGGSRVMGPDQVTPEVEIAQFRDLRATWSPDQGLARQRWGAGRRPYSGSTVFLRRDAGRSPHRGAPHEQDRAADACDHRPGEPGGHSPGHTGADQQLEPEEKVTRSSCSSTSSSSSRSPR